MGVGSKLLYHRRGGLDTISNSLLAPSTSKTIMVLPRGAQVDGDQTGTSTITVHAGHGILNGQKFIIGTDDSAIYEASSPTATTIPLASGSVTVTDGDVLVNLGADTGTGGTPDYDDNTVPVYTSADVATAEDPSDVVSDATSGKYEYWTTERLVWELVLLSGSADTIIRDVAPWRAEEVVEIEEVAAGPSGTPSASDRIQIYMKSDRLIIRYNDAGTQRYYFFNLTDAADIGALSHMTSEPG